MAFSPRPSNSDKEDCHNLATRLVLVGNTLHVETCSRLATLLSNTRDRDEFLTYRSLQTSAPWPFVEGIYHA